MLLADPLLQFIVKCARFAFGVFAPIVYEYRHCGAAVGHYAKGDKCTVHDSTSEAVAGQCSLIAGSEITAKPAYCSHCLRRSARPDPTRLIRPRGTAIMIPL